MSEKNIDISVKSSYSKNNQIRTKLLLFIDNEIQSKIKQKNNDLKISCEDEIQTKISFEETFSQKETDKYDFFPTNVSKLNKNNTSERSFSTIDDSNKILEKSHKRGNTHSKTYCNQPNKFLSNTIYYNKKVYTIKNRSRQSSTFLILPKQKKAADYLKTLCNNLKISKKDEKTIKQCGTINLKYQFLGLGQEKKSNKISSNINIPKPKKSNQCAFALFRKSTKRNSAFKAKNQLSRKSTNMILLKFNKI